MTSTATSFKGKRVDFATRLALRNFLNNTSLPLVPGRYSTTFYLVFFVVCIGGFVLVLMSTPEALSLH